MATPEQLDALKAGMEAGKPLLLVQAELDIDEDIFDLRTQLKAQFGPIEIDRITRDCVDTASAEDLKLRRLRYIFFLLHRLRPQDEGYFDDEILAALEWHIQKMRQHPDRGRNRLRGEGLDAEAAEARRAVEGLPRRAVRNPIR
jgi:hypothetical protein